MNPPPGVDARVINTPEGALQSILSGAPMRKGRVRLELPPIAENGHSVGMTVKVDSPMSEADHVRRIELIADKNPVPRVATFLLGPHNGRAEVESRLRLNGTQRVTAIAQLSDGSFWFDAVDVTVNELACLDGG
ncbi:MAG TPA: thiosulfate oxidation carrier protein SoxY [Burkholderiales bacterium]|jgi:sulfur-oxidizing protein SoxY|nr:thiosulfate oxidation carrier protein SoxY [Burkholderiales bacterium]